MAESTPPQPPAAAFPVAPVTRGRRLLSPVWIIPVIAAALGLWLVVKYYSAKGPEITVRFETADGIIGGKTPVLCRSVNIGTVRAVRLTDDLKGVLVTLDMTRDAARLLRKDTQIWVVRARYSSEGISGLNTLLSGNYLELQPGVSKDERFEFLGLENPPVTPPGVPGLRLKLIAQAAGGLGPGTSIVYKGISVGKIETRVFHPDTGAVEFSAFIQGEFASLVQDGTKFWNQSGIDLKIGADGVQLRTGTLESILAGGVTFSEPEKKGATSHHAIDGKSYVLYDSYDDSRKPPFNPTVPYLLLFSGSVRGLNIDAPVEFRGIRVGIVVGISFKYLPDDPDKRVPVLIKLDPDALTNEAEADYDAARAEIAQSVQRGLRATLKTGNLLTSQLYVDLDFQKDAPAAEIVNAEGYDLLPTAASGFDELQDKVSALLDKLKALPLEQTVQSANDTLASVKSAVDSINKLVASDDTKALPQALHKDLSELQQTMAGYNGQSTFYQDLSEILRQLDETLRSVKTLTGTLDRKPNSLIFGKPGDVAPPRGSH